MKKFIKNNQQGLVKSAKTTSDDLGSLTFIEDRDLPFSIKRIYYIYDVKKGIIRGHHAHKKLQQILICIKGKIRITLDDGSSSTKSFLLDTPSTTLFVDKMIWRTMEWLEDNAVLLVLASEQYTEADYIRNYGAFKKAINKR